MGNSEGGVTDTYGGGSVEHLEGYTTSERLNHLVPSTQILLRFRCANLPKMDATSQSDPFLVVEDISGKKPKEIGRTEVVLNNPNPNFSYSLKYIYQFQKIQNIKISVYDADDPHPSTKLDLKKQNHIGTCDTTISDIVISKCDGLTLEVLNKDKKRGSVTIYAEEVSEDIHDISFDVSIIDLNKDDKLFFNISSLNQANIVLNCFRSETCIPVDKVCKFRPVKLDSTSLCNGDESRTIVFTLYQYKSNGNHKLLADCKTSLRELRTGPELSLISQSKHVHVGNLVVGSISVVPKYTFFRYISSGCELNFMIGIDFTGSNGDPKIEGSLHHIDATSPNLYEQSIISVGNVLEHYDTDKLFPTYLFGCKIDGKVDHCYPLNGSHTSPEIAGVSEILKRYRTAVSQTRLGGPTRFAPLINRAAEIAKQYDQPNVLRYLILTIITDGVINDMNQTLTTIIENCHLPLSIIIIGVGDADFRDMESLDGDFRRLHLGSKYAQRDIVQFVSLSTLMKGGAVASDVLEEVPRQLTEYMALQAKIPPK